MLRRAVRREANGADLAWQFAQAALRQTVATVIGLNNSYLIAEWKISTA